VLAAPRERVQTADFRATGRLVRVEADGSRVSVPIHLKAHWFPGVLRVVVEVGADAQTKTSAHVPVHFLLEMRPGGSSSIRIAHPGDTAAAVLPVEKWSDGPLGDGFSYEDFLEPQFFWASQTVLEEAKYGARDCEVLKSVPGAADRTHYAEVKTWLDKGIGFPVYVEKTRKGSGAVEQFTYFGLRQTGGVWSASQVEAKMRGGTGSMLLIVERGSAQANLGLKDFRPEDLTRFQDH
jgi:hypothetical protein